MKKRLMLLVGLLVVLLSAASAAMAATPTVSPGWDGTAVTKAGVRFRNFGTGTGGEVYLGVPDLGNSANRTALDTGQPGDWASSNHIKFEYTPTGTDNLKVTLDASQQYVLTYDLGDVGALNYLQITVSDREAAANIDLLNVTLNGNPLGDFTATGFNDWQVKGLDFTAGFVIEGDLIVTGAQPSSNELNRVELKVGYVAPPPPPTVDIASDKDVFCGEDATLTIDLNDVTDLYGYQFEVTYDDTLVDATGAFVNTFFDTSTNASSPPLWQADCAGGVCQFGVSKLEPAAAISGSGTVAQITFTPQVPGTFNVAVNNAILSDRDANPLPGSTAAPLELTVCGFAKVSGNVSLQGRAAAPAGTTPPTSGTVSLADAGFGTYNATFDATGNFTIDNIKVMPGGTDYTISAAHSLYLDNELVQTLSPGDDLTLADTQLKGGDANNDGMIDLPDLTCVAGQFGMAPAVCGTTGSTDITADGLTNILDLVLPGGNYGLSGPQPW